jgi:tight adherence protein B
LQDLARRTELLELQVFALAVVVQQQLGGILADLLDRLAGLIRQRQRMRVRLRALTAEGRLQANVLLGLPPVVFAIMWMLKRSYVAVLLDHPKLLAGMVVAQLAGALWVRRTIAGVS